MKIFQPLILFPGLKLILQIVAIRGYGVFRDELYYIACSERLAAGYVDHPPLSIFFLRWVRELLGENLVSMRWVSAAVGAASVLMVGCIAKRLGGGWIAQSLAMAGFIAAPIYWFYGHTYSMNGFDVLFWAIVAFLILGLVQGATQRTWLALGLILGLGLLNKISVLWLGFGLAVGLLLTRERKHLTTAGPWVAAGLAGLIFLPHLLWQIDLGWPTLEFIAGAKGEKMIEVTPLDFVLGQIDLVGGWIGALFVSVGLWTLIGDREGRRYAILAWIYGAVFLLLMANGTSRSGYLAPAYTWMMAVSGWGSERLLGRLKDRARTVTALVLTSLLLAGGAVSLPFVLPILPVQGYLDYARTLGVEPSTAERKELGRLPQHYADMFGWKEKVEAARRAFENLPAEDRERACLLAFNYGVAGALENEALVLGEAQEEPSLPPVISGHNNYWLWGTETCTADVLIVLGADAEGLAQAFDSVERVDTVRCAHCMPYENDQPVFVVRGPKVPINEAWPRLKHYD